MRKIASGDLSYTDFLRRDCNTQIEVLEDDDNNKHVVFTELKDNSGPSITNSIEEAINNYALMASGRENTYFYERYEVHPEYLDEVCITYGRPQWSRVDSEKAREMLAVLEKF